MAGFWTTRRNRHARPQSRRKPLWPPIWAGTVGIGAWLLSCGGAAADPAWYTNGVGGFNPNIPDFYQHQNWMFKGPADGWEAGDLQDGWCMYIAFADLFFDLTKQGYKDLLASNSTDPKTWFATYYNPNNVPKSDLFTLVSDIRKTKGPQEYLNAKGHQPQGASPLLFSGVKVNANGKIDGTNGKMSAFQYYTEKARVGDEWALKLGPGTLKPPKPTEQGTWWVIPKLHVLAGAGLDVKTNTIFAADPDTNRGSDLANAGWPDLAKFPGNPPAGANSFGLKSVSTDPLPIPAAPKIGDPVSYNTYYGGFTLNDNNNTVTGDKADARFTGATLDATYSIGAPKAKKVDAAPVPGGEQATVAVNSGTATVDRVFIAPFAQVLSGSPSLFSFTLPGTAWDATTDSSDPFGNPLSSGGIEYDLLSGVGLAPGDVGAATLGTADDFSGFEIFLHIKDDPLNLWDFDVIGGPDNPLDVWLDQPLGVPEPASAALLSGFALLLLGTRRKSHADKGNV